MSEEQDGRIGKLLRADAPPERDPVFRLKVLERREQRQFRQRLYIMLAGALAIILVSAFAASIEAGARGTTGALAVAAAVASGCLAFRRSLPRILRRFSL